jgi:hypothetical protein
MQRAAAVSMCDERAVVITSLGGFGVRAAPIAVSVRRHFVRRLSA